VSSVDPDGVLVTEKVPVPVHDYVHQQESR
jgi:hypothetical protein